jgi:two-component system nitrogen regulation sensor histidine kinase NtrY
MPAPVMKEENLLEVIHQAVFLQKTGNPDILYRTEFPEDMVRLQCDSRQINQALINLMKNAAESIHAREPGEGGLPPGEIAVKIRTDNAQTVIAVEDNGKGLPVNDRERLTEPYVTTRAKGTGLGLAIVKKIMEDHRGELVLEDREGGGARVKLVFATGESRSDAAETAGVEAGVEKVAVHGA